MDKSLLAVPQTVILDLKQYDDGLVSEKAKRVQLSVREFPFPQGTLEIFLFALVHRYFSSRFTGVRYIMIPGMLETLSPAEQNNTHAATVWRRILSFILFNLRSLQRIL